MTRAKAGEIQAATKQVSQHATHGRASVVGSATATGTANVDGTLSGSATGQATTTAIGNVDGQLSASVTGEATVVRAIATTPVDASASVTATATTTAIGNRITAGAASVIGEATATATADVLIVPVQVGDITADDLVDQETPTLQIGETQTLQLLFSEPMGDWGTSGTIEDRYQQALDYLETATDGVVDTDTDDSGNPWFREALPETADVSSQLVRVSSHPNVDNDLPPMWGVIVGGEDQSQAIQDSKRVDVEVFVLGSTSEFADEADVRDRAEINVTHSIGGHVGDAIADESIPTVAVGQEESVTIAFNSLQTGTNVSEYVGLKDYLRYAQGIETEVDGAGRAAFEEDIPSVSPVSSQLVKVQTDGVDTGAEDFWAVVTGGSEAEPAAPTGRVLELDLFVLGTVTDYPDEAAIRDATELDLSWQVGSLLADGLATEAIPTLTRGESISVSLRFDPTDSDYQSLKNYLAYPQAVQVGETDVGVPWFRERLPSIAPVDSQVVQIQPSSDPGIEDFWAIIEGGSEATAPYPNERTVEVDMTVLGTVAEYASESDLRNALEADVI